MGELVLEASEHLTRIASNHSPDSKAFALSVKQLKEEGGGLAHAITNLLDRSLVKRLDERFLRSLAKALQDILRRLNQTAAFWSLFELKEPVPYTPDIAETLSRQSRAIKAALSVLDGDGHSLKAICDEIIQVEEEVDRFHELGIRYLIERLTDPVEIIQRKQVIDGLWKASRAARNIGYLMKSLTYDHIPVR